MQRALTALGLTTVRAAMVSWAISAAVLIVGVVLLVAGHGLGILFFALGAIGSVVTTFAMLTLRAGERGRRSAAELDPERGQRRTE